MINEPIYPPKSPAVKRVVYTVRLMSGPLRVRATHEEILRYLKILWPLRLPVGGRLEKVN